LLPNLTTLDFETEEIVGDPLLNPPKPVGLAVRYVDGKKRYITDWEEMIFTWMCALRVPVLFHNAPFDLSVARTHFGIPWPSWDKIHDTMYLCYLADPYAKTYSLKPSAERYLGIPPDEQDACKAWIMANVPGAKEKNWGAHLSKVPIEILEPYAKQDVEDTYLLFQELYPRTPTEPYDRERELMPILAEATIKGVPAHRPGLEQALEVYTAAFKQADNLIRAALQAPGLNPGSGLELATALDGMGLIDEWVLTPTGQRSTAIKNLRVKDQDVANLLAYRSTLKTYLGTFVGPWLEMSEADGRLHPAWNSTRGDRDGGTRTGRLSSARPNFQNPPNPAELVTPPGLPALPHLRNFILPEEGHVWVKRDFSSQEIRILAHFEDGDLAQKYRSNPAFDPHEDTRQLILANRGLDRSRKAVKQTAFGIIYGMGRPALSADLGCSYQEAAEMMSAYLEAVPGVEKLQRGTKRRGRSGQCIRTWGGREIYVEEPKVVKGEWRSFEYKLLNYLIQGSAADQTKQCLIQWANDKPTNDVFMATVHDEINISAPEDSFQESMLVLAEHMDNGCKFDVPFMSEGFVGPSWGEVEEYE
jgi:DNA polymerase I-like protein with 3'-5' exonuclease and polymerase domains